jgi:hypothetical protein
MPITLYVMIRVVQGATNRIKPATENKNQENPEGGSKS